MGNILNVNEVAELLGVSRSYVYRLTSERKLPHSKPGGKLVFFQREDVEKWATGNRVRTAEEIAASAANYQKGGGK